MVTDPKRKNTVEEAPGPAFSIVPPSTTMSKSATASPPYLAAHEVCDTEIHQQRLPHAPKASNHLLHRWRCACRSGNSHTMSSQGPCHPNSSVTPLLQGRYSQKTRSGVSPNLSETKLLSQRGHSRDVYPEKTKNPSLPCTIETPMSWPAP
jgi:hypothetical protein